MLKINKIWGIILLLFFTACENKEFNFVLPSHEEIEFSINENDGNFEENKTVTRNDIMDDLSDLDGDVVIERLDIESISVKPKNLPAGINGFDNLNLSIVSNGLTTPVFVNQDIGFQSNNEIIITNLVVQGINQLKNILEGYVIGNNFEPFTLIASGNSVPDNVPIQMSLIIDIKFSVVFTKDLEAPFFMGK